jgi:hypothetical protein
MATYRRRAGNGGNNSINSPPAPDWRSGEYAPLVRHGDPAQLIAALEQEQACDLVIIGKHGQHKAEELLLGSVTKHVLAESQCDVLVTSDIGTPQGHASDA